MQGACMEIQKISCRILRSGANKRPMHHISQRLAATLRPALLFCFLAYVLAFLADAPPAEDAALIAWGVIAAAWVLTDRP